MTSARIQSLKKSLLSVWSSWLQLSLLICIVLLSAVTTVQLPFAPAQVSNDHVSIMGELRCMLSVHGALLHMHLESAQLLSIPLPSEQTCSLQPTLLKLKCIVLM